MALQLAQIQPVLLLVPHNGLARPADRHWCLALPVTIWVLWLYDMLDPHGIFPLMISCDGEAQGMRIAPLQHLPVSGGKLIRPAALIADNSVGSRRLRYRQSL